MLKNLGVKARRTMRAFLGTTVAAAFCAVVSPALAGSVTQPGETIGLAAGAPLPVGVYFVDTFDWGVRKGENGAKDVTLGVNIPVLAWATPTTIAGGRLQLLGALPELEVGVQDSDHDSGLYNPFLAAQLAWDLGSGFGVSYMLGIYLPVGNKLGFDTTSITQRAAVSYTADGWNLTANGIYGIATDSMSKTTNPDFVNLDLTATKALGKWSVGPVALASWDVSKPTSAYKKQSQFALGGLVGYGFDQLTVQAYLTSTVAQENYGGNDTRGWGRVILPF